MIEFKLYTSSTVLLYLHIYFEGKKIGNIQCIKEI